MGDNRYVSLDSRDERIGLVDREDIMGKVVSEFTLFLNLEH